MKNTYYILLASILIGIVIVCGCTAEVPGVIERVPTAEPTEVIPTEEITPVETTPEVVITDTPMPEVVPTTVETTEIATTKTPVKKTTTKKAQVIPTTVGLGTLSITTSGSLGGSVVPVYIAGLGVNTEPITLDAYGNLTGSPEYTKVSILPDGTSDIINLAPGDYVAYLPAAKNGTATEWANFSITTGTRTYISFSGASYRSSSTGSGC